MFGITGLMMALDITNFFRYHFTLLAFPFLSSDMDWLHLAAGGLSPQQKRDLVFFFFLA
jgi:hypothetical protein